MVSFQDFKRALRITKRNIVVRLFGFEQYEGDDMAVCSSIVKGCWNSSWHYLQASTGHFSEFWTRDFGICSNALVNTGWRIEAIKTLDYALSIFARHDKITTTISNNVPADFPCYSADSLPLLIRAIKNADSKFLLEKYKDFLTRQIDYYFQEVFDEKNCMIRKDRHFSSMKDLSKRKSSAYDNSMLYMLCSDLEEMEFHNPFSGLRKRIKNQIKDNLWNGRYFYDDLTKKKVVAGDAQVFPFWCGVFDANADKKMFATCLKEMIKNKLDSPFPMKYTNTKKAISPMIFVDFLVGDYERDAVWMHLGLCFLDLVRHHDKELLKKYLEFYKSSIKKYRTFLEVYDRKGKRFSSLFYMTDEGMLWAGKYLYLRNLFF